MKETKTIIRPLSGPPRFSVSALLQVVALTCVYLFFFRLLGPRVLLFLPVLLIFVSLVLFGRSNRFTTALTTWVWYGAWILVIAALYYAYVNI